MRIGFEVTGGFFLPIFRGGYLDTRENADVARII